MAEAVSNTKFHEFCGLGKSIVNDPFDVAAKYADSKPYGLAKAIYVLGVDVPRALGLMSEDNPTGDLIKHNFTLFKLARSPGMLISNTNRAARSLGSYLTGTPISNGKEREASVKPLSRVVRDSLAVVSPVNELSTFFSKTILFIPAASLRPLKGINGLVLVFLMGWNALDTLDVFGRRAIKDITNPVEKAASQERLNQAFLRIISEITYSVLGVCIGLSVFSSVVVPPMLFTALTTVSVVASILEFYCKEIGKEKKLI